MHVRTLGRAELSASGTRLGPEAPVSFSLLLHLVLERDRWVARTQLQEMLFPQQDRVHARHSLRQSVYTLRKDGFPIEGSGPAVHIPAKAIVDDYSTLLTPQLEGERELSDLMGGWLAGFEPTISPTYSHWFEGKRSEIALRMRTALLAELAVHKRNARWAQCERTCRAILSLDPLNEEATLGLAEALALTGAKVQAIRILERYQEEMPTTELRIPARVLKRRISEAPRVDGSARETRLFGREAEFRLITDRIESVRHSRGASLGLLGESGMGKTRLIAEATAWASVSGICVASHVAQPHDQLRPLGVIAALVPQLRALRGSLGCAPEALGMLSRLQSLPGGSDPALGDPRDSDAPMGWALEELVAAVTSESPLLICIDDAHWADEASVSLLGRLVARQLPGLAIVFGARDLPPLLQAGSGAALRSLTLSPLSSAAAHDLLVSLVRDSDIPTALQDERVHSVALGNPYYIHALARHLRANPRDPRFPTELEELIERHLLELSDVDSVVLAAVCVLGRHATFAHLEELLSLPRHVLLQSLGRVESHGFVVTSEGVVRATHPLIAEAAVSHLPESARQYLHYTSACTLQRRAEHSQDPSLIWDTVALARKGGAKAEAVKTARQCAHHALSFGHASAACDILNAVTSPDLWGEERQATQRELLTCAAAAGRWAIVAETAAQLRLGVTGCPAEEQAQLAWLVTEADWHRSHAHSELSPRLFGHLHEEMLSDTSRLQIADLLAICASNTGNRRDADAAAAFAEEVLRKDAHSTQALQILSVVEATFGDLRRARSYSESILSEVKYPPSQLSLRLRMNAASCLRFSGSAPEAIFAMQDAIADAEKFGFLSNAYAIANEIAFSFLIQGEAAAAKPWLSKAEALLPLCGDNVDPYILLEGKSAYCILTRQDAMAREFADGLSRSALRRPRRIREFVRALNWQARVRIGEPGPSGEELDQLTSDYLELRHHLESDFYSLAIIELLKQAKRTEKAKLLVEEYLSFVRRELSPVLPPLVSLARELAEGEKTI
ncbi:MAG: ATP-binding protein [Gemmatimonadaceae bacterium]